MSCEENIEGQRWLAVETQPLTDGHSTGRSRDAEAGAVSRFVEFYNLNSMILQLNRKKTNKKRHPIMIKRLKPCNPDTIKKMKRYPA